MSTIDKVLHTAKTHTNGRTDATPSAATGFNWERLGDRLRPARTPPGTAWWSCCCGSAR